MAMPRFSVVVPASTANLGPGFDSVGLALNLYMTVEVYPSDVWKVSYAGEDLESLASGEDNLIVQTIKHVAERYDKSVTPLSLHADSTIPLGKGFGSSASAIAGGIEIANELFQLDLSTQDKLLLGSQLEGHADNVSAALLGGAVISYYDGDSLEYIHLEEPAVGVVVLVPPNALATTEARGLLPQSLSHKEATRCSSASTLLAAAIMSNDWKTAGKMMELDGFHEPFRKKLYPEFDAIRKKSAELGAFGMTISGAGPSLFVAVPQGKEEEIAQQLDFAFPFYKSLAIQPSKVGTSVK